MAANGRLPTNAATSRSPSRSHRPLNYEADLILPRTGERVNRAVTFRDPLLINSPEDDEFAEDNAPLLGRSGSFVTWRNGPSRLAQVGKRHLRRIGAGLVSNTGVGIFKCSLAYSLGSLATFVPVIATFLGTQDGKHMVATVTVYFHPARSQGSMYEATLLAACAFLYALIISFASMGVSIGFGDAGLRSLGHAVVLIVFCGGGLGFVGWLKQRLGSPLVNVACSLTSLSIITVLTKEGAVQTSRFSTEKITQVLKMVLMGIIATTFVCLVVNPISARKELRKSMAKTMGSFGDMLAIITSSFLEGSEARMRKVAFVDASDQYKTVFTSLVKDLQEAKNEHYILGSENEYIIQAKLVKCVQSLAQNIGGLRSAAATQFQLLAEAQEGPAVSTSGSRSDDADFTPSPFSPASTRDFAHHTESETSSNVSDTRSISSHEYDGASKTSNGRSVEDIFAKFVTRLGPSMKSLAYTLKSILDELPYGPGPEYRVAINDRFKNSLTEAIELYRHSRSEALDLLYGDEALSDAEDKDVATVIEEVAASCGHFSFSLLDFATEVKHCLSILEELEAEEERTPQRRSWQWIVFWRRSGTIPTDGDMEDLERHEHRASSEDDSVRRQISASTLTRRHFELGKLQTLRETIRQKLWRASRFFRRDDIKFAFKVGAGAALFALPSFVDATRPIYSHWRGEWGLLSYMLVCSMTIGASNTTGSARFLGTCAGAICAIVAWNASQANAYLLAFFGWLVSTVCFYLIIVKKKGPMGRFILLTYNLSALYAYSLSVKDEQDDEDEGGVNPYIAEIALHRVVAVMTGCLWGLVITRVIWPISARQKVKGGLSVLWLRMGLVWKRDPLSVLLENNSSNAYMNVREEVELRRHVSRLDDLRGSAASELELKGPFPNAAISRILNSTSRMLDAFHALNMVLMKDLRASEGERGILKFTTTERAQLCARISHIFQVLASSMKLEYPLTGQLPDIEHTRDRLLMRIFTFRRNAREAHTPVTESDYALLYAYTLVTGQLSQELQTVAKELEELFGVVDEDVLKLE
ncbi:MAG: hypothetical protein M1833_006677 [Piccolia ochrophora]|nr:MAG: hypothetical protein M1833_006677 [Piccolia ochrophora]